MLDLSMLILYKICILHPLWCPHLLRVLTYCLTSSIRHGIPLSAMKISPGIESICVASIALTFRHEPFNA